jgi:hypothetical protein
MFLLDMDNEIVIVMFVCSNITTKVFPEFENSRLVTLFLFEPEITCTRRAADCNEKTATIEISKP